MTALLAVRHPQTTWNVEERYQGRLEAPLSRAGREQSKLTARAFAGQSIAAVYSSPLQRALDLAREIAESADAPLIVEQRFTEIALGPWEGLYRSEIARSYPDLYRSWYLEPQTVAFPGGESLGDVRSRSQAGIASILDRFPSETVVLVSHSAVIQSLVAAALRIDAANIHSVRISNCGITTICGPRTPGSLLSLNSTDHLYRSPVSAAAAQNCVSWEERRVTL